MSSTTSGGQEEEAASWVNLDASSALSSWTHARALREKNKSLRRVYDEAKMHYGADVAQNEELAKRTAIALNLRRRQVNNIMGRMQAAQNLDLCFLVDSTGSMLPHIDGVKNSVRDIVNTLTSNAAVPAKTVAGTGTVGPIVKKIHLAFIAYRDFGDTSQFEVLDFTDSVDTFHVFCGSISAKGGGHDSGAEDVFGGLEKVNQLTWTTDGSTRVLFHIADFPCHGIQYHEGVSDYYPGGDPEGRSIDSLLGQLSARDIDYYFGRITEHTDQMLNKFSTIYEGGIETCDIQNPEQIYGSVVEMTSIAVTRAGPSNRRGNAYKGPFAIAEPNWQLLPMLNGLLLSYELPDSVEAIIAGHPLTPKQPAKAKLKLAASPFAQGVERVAYYGRDMTDRDNPKDIVLKKYTSATGFLNSVLHYEVAIQMQTIAAYLASMFTEQIAEKIGVGYSFAIKFLKTQVFSYTMMEDNKAADQRIYMSCERRYPASCKFLRFTNNVNYTMLEQTATQNGVNVEFVRQMIAFSHWTYQVTKGTLMVVDLQGIISTEEKSVELTDPAIHCTDLTRFGRTNLGLDGMKCFFGRHECNEICTKMGLTFPVELVKVEGQPGS